LTEQARLWYKTPNLYWPWGSDEPLRIWGGRWCRGERVARPTP